ncbi:hypothetical protein SAMN05444407_11464 [Chryseobacterium contaminans]|uniref:Uncharacterized protein n=1 Tax=Chryseobacterium contaminans TaxID=1423959 RepID=A0A1M7IF41_9FLAO|nr:hypothetical protein SAMN05444407_11464 [Chryseobacterium contaminans]
MKESWREGDKGYVYIIDLLCIIYQMVLILTLFGY